MPNGTRDGCLDCLGSSNWRGLVTTIALLSAIFFIILVIFLAMQRVEGLLSTSQLPTPHHTGKICDHPKNGTFMPEQKRQRAHTFLSVSAPPTSLQCLRMELEEERLAQQNGEPGP